MVTTKNKDFVGRRAKVIKRKSGRNGEIGLIIGKEKDEYKINFTDSLETLSLKEGEFVVLRKRGIHKNS
jgi:hypothetical protein